MLTSSPQSRPLYIAADIGGIIFSFAASCLIKFTHQRGGAFAFELPYRREYIFIFTLWAIFILVIFHFKNIYLTDRAVRIPAELGRTLSALLYAGLLVGAIIFFTKYKFFSRQVYFSSLAALIIFLGGFRFIRRLVLRRLIAKGFHTNNVLIVGADSPGQFVCKQIQAHPLWGLRIAGFLDERVLASVQGLPVLGGLADFPVIAKQFFIDEVIVTLRLYEKALPELIRQARRLHVNIRLFPGRYNELSRATSVSYVGFLPLITYGEKPYYLSGFVIKRAFDVMISFLALILLLPLFLIIGILIKFDSPGLVFYIRPRMGMKGRVFKFYKFRSMAQGADKAKERLLEYNEVRDGVIFKIRKDPRVTRVGAFLRRFSLDELPQLINVLKGDMSLVGPRPFPVEESKRIEYKHLPRLNIRPGITGLPQVRGRSDLTFRQWARWDLWYINNWSLWLDFYILLWTIPVVLKGKGAY